MKVQQAKQRFGIIGNSVLLDRSINIALQVAPTDISVFVSGESGTGKESIPKIIHQASKRKHNNYIAVNCGAIPEGTIDSELFGHEKGSFTGAHDSRKGYFEVADGGTIFLDEVAELPLSTQVRLLRVLESGEFIKVGSSTPIKINVRVIAATNINIPQAIKNGKFREDLYYRLNTVSIFIPSLRERKEDISLLFRKFASDFSEQYNTPSIRLDEEAMDIITNYNWPGNIRQLKNFVSQLSVIEKERNISAQTILDSLPENKNSSNTPILFEDKNKADLSEREILYKVLFDMKRDLTELKKITFDLMKKDGETETTQVFNDLSENEITLVSHDTTNKTEESDSSFSLADHEKMLIKQSLEKHKGKRKLAAEELGISERTLYRKIKEFNL
ncbi:MAG: sigma-54-dependent Fis family transcriptional regulator [Flavobacteriales bacterium]|jgi:transcriptional regulator with PAS, ATPase and Fis domain|nr:sigma-54-dependent Fis family transcriptional regulator [Flavobacteriales bacterium]MBT4738318.1 sigma-54-dependent Fis family transcriptional regulator [Flavobacteriales bacterium]MBT7619662.1 sigma-54-dependent Fis family transcriptional regulator [Flavobacteriales bacterium]MBT7727064.1 sigma-54-dependent Fis family transcriptional regulator [Flavobacteriales bacterium]